MFTSKMMSENAADGGATQDTICFAELSGGMVVIRVSGRGTFANSVEFKKLTDLLADRLGADEYRFILDLDDCATMDSTFMGVLASVGLRQKKSCGEKMAVVNANEQCCKLLTTLGLSFFLDVRPCGQSSVPDVDSSSFKTAQAQQVSKTDRIIHMIEAHQNLCDIQSENTVRFDSVLKYLDESLRREQGK